MKIIIGLGNPGEKYKQTRHNVGFMAMDAISEKFGLCWQIDKKTKNKLAKNNNFLLAKPLTFMNESGKAVQLLLSYYKLLPKKLGIITAKNSDLSKNLTVIHDDLDIELGKYKISIDSRSAGNRGVESVINYLKTKNFKRIRIGIKTPDLEKIPAKNFVLQKFNAEELKKIKKVIDEITKNLQL